MIDRVYWKIPGQILVFELTGEVTLQDVRDVSEGIRTKLATESDASYVDIFLDSTAVSGYHPETLNIGKMFGASKKHERVRWNIIINPRPNPVVDFVVRTVMQLFKTHLSIVPTFEAAMSFVQSKTASEKS